MEKVVFVGAARTPIGKLGGALATLTAAQLGTIAIQAALERAAVAPEEVNEVYLGCAIQAGQGKTSPARPALPPGCRLPFRPPPLT